MATLSYPGFEVSFYLQTNGSPLIIREKAYAGDGSAFDRDILAISTNNDMSNDNPVFSLVLNAARYQWEQLLQENDICIISVSHDYYSKSYYPIMVGMISNVQKQENYADGIMQYTITGMGMSKVLSNVSIGALQEINPVVEWLPDDPDKGIKFTGSTSAQIVRSILGRFVLNNDYTSYTYNVSGNSTPLPYFINTNITNNVDESLVNRLPFTSYSGTLTQFIKSVSAPPFNEFFWTFGNKDTAYFNYRPTQFDPQLWKKLKRVSIDDTDIQQTDLSKNDVEQYSIFKVNIPVGVDALTNLAMGVYPLTNKSLIKKYGYKKMEVDNGYIYSEDSTSSEYGISLSDVGKTEEQIKKEYPSYETVSSYLNTKHSGMKSDDAIRKNKTKATNNLYTKMQGRLGYGQCEAIISTYISKRTSIDIGYHIEYAEYQDILNNVKFTKDASKATSLSTGQTKLAIYTQKLFNWYADNSKFYSGTVKILGKPNINVGEILVWYDLEAHCIWECYIEAISHDYSFQSGYITTIGVTRGVQIPQSYTGDPSNYRFTFFWGKYTQFLGGYFGEPSLKDDAKQALADQGFNGNFSNESDGSGGAMLAVQNALAADNKSSKYRMGAGRSGQNPLNDSTIIVDCSSFVWWCFHNAGIDLKGGKTGMTTDTIASDHTNLTTVSSNHSSKSAAMKNLKVGDIIFFNTYKEDGHVALYLGNGDFIGAQSSTGIAIVKNFPGNSYWWGKFGGHVMRY